MGVEGFVGYHGQGKTYSAMATKVLPAIQKGVPIVTNAILKGYVLAPEWVESAPGTPMPAVLHFETWDEMIDVVERMVEERCRAMLFMDEAGKFLSSRFWAKLDERIMVVLQERRKIGRGLDFIWTAPAFSKVDTNLRDVTQLVHTCRRFGGSEYSHDEGRPPWFFRVKTYRGEEYETPTKRKLHSKTTVPFSKLVGDAYETGIVTMGKKNERKLASAPDMRDVAQEPAIIPVLPIAAPSSGRRGRRKA